MSRDNLRFVIRLSFLITLSATVTLFLMTITKATFLPPMLFLGFSTTKSLRLKTRRLDLEIWVINPLPAAQNDQDDLFILERTFHVPDAPEPWQRQNYLRRGSHLRLNH